MLRCKSSIERKKEKPKCSFSNFVTRLPFFSSICGFFLQHPPLFLHPSICLRRQSANGPVIISLQLRKKTLCFFFTHKTVYLGWSAVPSDDTRDLLDLLDGPSKPRTPAATSRKPPTLGDL